jgi:predicted negative regulator of RcsB-dependent stress response
MSTTSTTIPKPRRRWLQFSLRTLMVLMLTFGCGFGWLAYEAERMRAQRKAASAIEKLGGSVGYADESDGRVRGAVAWMGKLFGEDLSGDVSSVILDGPSINDAALAHLRGLAQLRWLSLTNTRITDAGLTHLRGLRELGSLELANTMVSDTGLAHLRGLTKLWYLDLNNTQVSDAGAKELKKALPYIIIDR